MSGVIRLGAACLTLLGFSLSSTNVIGKPVVVAHAASAPVPHVARIASQAVPLQATLKGAKPKPPKTQDPPSAFDCTSPGLNSTYASGGPPGKRGKAVKIYLGTVRKYIPFFEGKLRMTLGIAVCLNYPKRFNPKCHDALACTQVYDPLGQMVGPTVSTCWIEVNPAVFPAPPAHLSQLHKNTLAHELFHCFQGVIMGIPATYTPPWHLWVREGQAEWAGATAAGPDPNEASWWTQYLMNPSVALADVSADDAYREIGFYSHLLESGINPWDVIAPMLRAPDDAAAFHAAVYGDGDGAAQYFLDSWASGFFRDKSRGASWDTTGPGIPASVAPTPNALQVGTDQTVSKQAAPYTEGLYILVPDTDIVTLEGEGHVRLSDGSTDVVLNGSGDFCVKSGGCTCPEGESFEGPPLTSLNGGNTALALTGGEQGSTVTATGQSLDEYCKPRDKCLVGTWQVSDESQFVSTSSQGVFELTGMSGTETISFTKKGNVTVNANQFTLQLSEPSTGGSGSIGIANGTTTAQWTTPTKGDLEFANVDIGDYTLVLDGQSVDGASFFGPADESTSSMTYTCAGNTLNLYPIPSDPTIAPIVLTKVKS